MTPNELLQNWKKKIFIPVYWLEGEEEFFIDTLTNYAENSILSEAEAGFNKTVFYGKDADVPALINACKRYPMFAEKQVVLLKEAQQLRNIEDLDAYISSPLNSTIFVVAYKGKTLDKRTKLYKSVQNKGVVISSPKLKDDKVSGFIADAAKHHGYTIHPKAVMLLHDHIGNDLSRINNEIEKVCINVPAGKEISDADIENFVGISREYNVFELQDAIANKNLSKALKIVHFVEQNPKAMPIQMALPALYSFFSKLYAAQDKGGSEEGLKSIFYYPAAMAQAKKTMRNFNEHGIEKILLLLHHYNLKSVGINDASSTPGELLKEMVMKILL